MHLLIIEDNLSFLSTVLPLFLAQHEHTIAHTIAEAKTYEDTLADFDACLCDYDLPDGKGDVLVRWLKQRRPTLPVVAFSAHQRGNDALYHAGADASCGKMRFHEIGAQLRALLPQS